MKIKHSNLMHSIHLQYCSKYRHLNRVRVTVALYFVVRLFEFIIKKTKLKTLVHTTLFWYNNITSLLCWSDRYTNSTGRHHDVVDRYDISFSQMVMFFFAYWKTYIYLLHIEKCIYTNYIYYAMPYSFDMLRMIILYI